MTRDLYSNLTPRPKSWPRPSTMPIRTPPPWTGQASAPPCSWSPSAPPAPPCPRPSRSSWRSRKTDDKDHGTWTDVADTHLSRAVSGANDGCFAVLDGADDDNAVYVTQYRGHQRYCRVVVNLSGTHATGTPIGVIALRGHAHVAPVNA